MDNNLRNCKLDSPMQNKYKSALLCKWLGRYQGNTLKKWHTFLASLKARIAGLKWSEPRCVIGSQLLVGDITSPFHVYKLPFFFILTSHLKHSRSYYPPDPRGPWKSFTADLTLRLEGASPNILRLLESSRVITSCGRHRKELNFYSNEICSESIDIYNFRPSVI